VKPQKLGHITLTASHENSNATRGKSIDFLPALFLAAAIVFLPLGSESSSLNSLAIVFVSIVLEAIPFMLVGSLVGGFIEAFVSRERMATLLPQKGWLAVCIAAGAGLIFPVCECAVVPVVRRLTGKGLPLSAAIAYLLGGPIVNPIVAASTALAYAFDWRIVVLRLILGYGIAVAIGLLMGRLFTSAEAIKNNGAAFQNNALSCGCHHIPLEHTHHESLSEKSQPFPVITNPAGNSMAFGSGCSHPASDGWVDKAGAAFTHAMDDFLAVGHYLVIGAFIAALAQTYIDRSSFLSLTAAPVLSVVLMMALAIMLNLCSEADAFIAASFRGLIPIPAQMAFLLTGPMFDLKLLLMYQSVFKRKVIVVLASLILAAVLVITIGLEMLNGVLQ
jgi:uncharacterized membrane protein YraQ (UPF0718 family)